jgi:SSS family solute:Na+ symporter
MAGNATLDWIDIVVIVGYLLTTGYLGWLGYRGTRTAADFLVGGRSAHPVVMAVSYAATFISTAAIVGFGGVAAMFGMGLMWLTFVNILFGILLAFTLLGEPTRRLGHHLSAHTFPELLGARYQSKGIQVLAGLVIFLFMPLYSAAVMTGGSVFVVTQFGVSFEVALLVMALITAAYVIPGGLKAVMYTDTLQGFVMILAMIYLLWFTYSSLGGVEPAHRALTDLADLVPPSLQAIGHEGWTRMPTFGWGSTNYDLWWTVVSAIILGVGIGVLAQPQLVVRFMTVRSRRELDRAVPTGAVFILLLVGTPYLVGSLSNAWFTQHGPLLTGQVVKEIDAASGHALVGLMKESSPDQWAPVINPKTNQPTVVPMAIASRETARDSTGQPLELVSGRSPSVVYAKGEPDQIIPTYINTALPRWFGLVFFLALLAAAMSTMSSQFHTIGTAAGRDLFERLTGRPGREPSLLVMRVAIVIGLLAAVTISYTVRQEYVVARFTAIFFGLCAATFLPAYIGGLFWRRATRTGALASMLVGMSVSVFWLLLVKAKEAAAIGLVQMVTGGKTSLLADHPNWPMVDPIVIALPLAVLTLVLVSLVTRPVDPRHLAVCFPEEQGR